MVKKKMTKARSVRYANMYALNICNNRRWHNASDDDDDCCGGGGGGDVYMIVILLKKILWPQMWQIIESEKTQWDVDPTDAVVKVQMMMVASMYVLA